MKKINLLFLIVGLLIVLSSVGHTEIEKKVDSFDGSAEIVGSIGNIGPFNFVVFGKIKSREGLLLYTLMISRAENEWWFFKESPLEMKIAGKIYNLPIDETGSFIWSTGWLITSGTWAVNKEMRKRILKADSIIIRVHYSQHVPTTLTIPSNMLNEWKQVIREKF